MSSFNLNLNESNKGSYVSNILQLLWSCYITNQLSPFVLLHIQVYFTKLAFVAIYSFQIPLLFVFLIFFV